ncbi:MAG: asparagine synthase (glutamine-hydrolyzing) [Bacteroidota bacterium]
MCGIAGLWAPGLDASERRALVEGMVRRLVHRGPDGTAVWSDGAVTIGLARLAIVAPEYAVAVSTNESGTIAAVTNGEIYNYREIRDQLASGGPGKAGPDTTVLPHLYEIAGIDFPSRLDGMFAVAVWDARAERLVLARDRAGEKPLFFAAGPSRFAFASEPAALLGLPWVGRDPSPAAIARYLVHGFFGYGDSAFSDIRQIRAGHTLEVGADLCRERRYWRPWDVLLRAAPRSAPAQELALETRHALATAVESRLPSDVPFGVFLSGGLDSSLVAALAATGQRRFPTFSLRLPGRSYDESTFARDVARQIGSDHHELAIDHADAEELLERISEGMDQPLGDPSLLPTWALARFASENVRVVLTGEGGDELFAGYPTYVGHRLASLTNRMPQGVSRALSAIVRRLEPANAHVSLPHLLERLLSVRGLRPLDRHLEWFGAVRQREVLSLLSPALRDSLQADDPRAHLTTLENALLGLGRADTNDPDLVVYQLLDFELYLGGGLLTKVDRATMAHGLESRAPFLHHPLVEFAMALPPDAKLRGAKGKWVLKRAARGVLPDRIIDRRKQGFSPPFSSWVRGPLRPLVLSKLTRERLNRAGILDPAGVARILAQHLDGERECGRAIWTLLSLQLWAERWLAGTSYEDLSSAIAGSGLSEEVGVAQPAGGVATTRA